jgi:hypothetical protein
MEQGGGREEQLALPGQTCGVYEASNCETSTGQLDTPSQNSEERPGPEA